ncbi:MAG: hypothetical protein M3277_07960 [Actinomycetota bacterium]|nr:hypothetical protein [Actinomycetota bacterium]
MVETIAPVVYGRRRDYLIAVAFHSLAATIAALILGLALGTVGMLVGAPWGRAGMAFVVVAGVLYAARELFGLPIPLFDRKQQVPDWWRTFYSPRVAAALYGAGLGLGFLTYLRHGTFVVVAAVALASGDPLVGALIAAPFGLARGLTALVSARSSDEVGPARIVTRLSDLAARTQWTRIANATACLAIAVVSLSEWV